MGVPAVTTEKAQNVWEASLQIPQALVYEMVRGQPVYYRGYEKVLVSDLSPEVVMGSGKRHVLLIWFLLHFLSSRPGKEHYLTLTDGVDGHLDKHHWRALDIVVFERGALEAEGPTDECVHASPAGHRGGCQSRPEPLRRADGRVHPGEGGRPAGRRGQAGAVVHPSRPTGAGRPAPAKPGCSSHGTGTFPRWWARLL